MALALQHVDEPHLVLRSDPGDDADLAHLGVELVVAQRRELGAGEGAALDPELAADRGGRRGVVAGDHADLDPGVLAERDRVPRLLARRVDDADQGEQRQVLDLREQVAAGVEGRGVDVARGHGEHPQALAGETVVLRQDAVAVALDPDERSVHVPAHRGPREQHVGRALHEAANHLPAVFLHLVEGGHELVLRVERNLADTREGAPRLVDVEPALRGQDDERRLGRVADDLAVTHRRVVGEGHREEERLEGRVRLARDAKDLALGGVALALDRVATPGDQQLARGHLVQRQRARLVGADRRRRAERLHRPQPLDDRSLRRERLRPEREHGRDDRRQPGRDRRDREGDADHEQVVEVVAADQPEQDHERQRDRRHDRDEHGQLVELARERRLLLLDPASIPEICPTSVAMPVAVTTISPRPRVTVEFM